MKNLIKTALIAMTLTITGAQVYAADYSAMSTQELAQMRGSFENATYQDRNAFQNEWQYRMQSMNQEERQQYTMTGQSGSGQSQGMMQGKGNGQSGSNRMYSNSGSTSGQGRSSRGNGGRK